MTINRLPSGSYRIQLQEEGVRYSITVPYKPTQKQAYELIRAKIDAPTNKYATMTLKEACEAYKKLKDGVLSPSTIRGYSAYLRNMPDSFTSLLLKDIDQATLQGFINQISKEKSSKYVRNINGYIMTVINYYMPDNNIKTTLPPKQKKAIYIPTEDDVKRLLQQAHDTEYYVPLALACLSLRRSEICALTIDDLSEDNVLTINKALVSNENDKFVIKNTTKTSASTRSIVIPQELADRIREQGYVFKYYPNSIDNYLRRTLPKLNIPYFSIHKLRHFFASYMSGKYTNEQIMAMGGWETDEVMKNTYTHVMREEEAKVSMANDLAKFF